MRALVQRVTSANVRIDCDVVGEIGPGLLIFVCAMANDTDEMAHKLASKVTKLRIFADEKGRMNRSLIDQGGSALVISQFTLAADTSRGNRPGFSAAAPPGMGEQMVQLFTNTLIQLGIPCAQGKFGADMQVTLTNDGPCTIWIDTE